MILHAGLIARHDPWGWRGVLIQGPSGAGKSDLALRALEAGFRLVADDRVLVWISGGRLFGRAPEPLSGLLEVRGLGVLAQAPLAFCEVVLVVSSGVPQRTPDPVAKDILGLSIASIELDLMQPAAPAKLRRALDAFDVAHKKRI